jgi:imidazolonepropionase
MASLSSTLRSTAPKTLQMRLRNWAQMLVSHGTTTFEVGTGSGLDLPSEIKGLQAARALHGHPLDVTCAFLAGRPESDATGRTPAEVEQVTEVLLPIIRRRRLADFCAVECGPEAFDAEQSRQILEAAKQLRFGLRLVADPQAQSGIASLAVEMRALTIENPGSLEDEEADLLARSATVVTYLPAAVYASGSGAYPPARELIDRGAAVALATGFGPASPTLSMPMVLSLACREMGFSPEEAITAATLNGAAALGRAHLQGSLEPGKQADLAMFEVRDYREIPYYFGFNPCVMTMKKGRVLYEGCGSSHG